MINFGPGHSYEAAFAAFFVGGVPLFRPEESAIQAHVDAEGRPIESGMSLRDVLQVMRRNDRRIRGCTFYNWADAWKIGLRERERHLTETISGVIFGKRSTAPMWVSVAHFEVEEDGSLTFAHSGPPGERSPLQVIADELALAACRVT